MSPALLSILKFGALTGGTIAAEEGIRALIGDPEAILRQKAAEEGINRRAAFLTELEPTHFGRTRRGAARGAQKDMMLLAALAGSADQQPQHATTDTVARSLGVPDLRDRVTDAMSIQAQYTNRPMAAFYDRVV